MLTKALEAGDIRKVISILEERLTKGSASESEGLLYGILLLFPPFGDYEGSMEALRTQTRGRRAFEGAVWASYVYATLNPQGEKFFAATLESQNASAIGTHMLSLVAHAEGNPEVALLRNRESRSIRIFPSNALAALKRDSQLLPEERADLWSQVCDLTVSKNAETEPNPSTVEGACQRYWENLIVGTRVTSQVWSERAEAFATR